MSEQANSPKQECKCIGDRKVKALEKQIAELKSEIIELRKEVAILRKAVRK